MCNNCEIYMDNVQITNSLTSISLPVGSFTKRLVANTGCGNTAEVTIVFKRAGSISCISVGDIAEQKTRINEKLLSAPTNPYYETPSFNITTNNYSAVTAASITDYVNVHIVYKIQGTGLQLLSDSHSASYTNLATNSETKQLTSINSVLLAYNNVDVPPLGQIRTLKLRHNGFNGNILYSHFAKVCN